jgi:phage baseplate assembly protein W
MGYPIRPHFSYPFQRNGSKVEVVEQGTTEHLISQQHAVAVTPQGFRVDQPDFGWPFPEFAMIPIDLIPLEKAFHRWVPDARFTTSEWADAASAAVRHIQVLTEEVG